MMRKRGRSVVSLFLAMAMVLSMAVPAFAVDVPEDSQIVDQVEVTPNGGDSSGDDSEPGESEPPQSSEESPDPENSEAPTESVEPEETDTPDDPTESVGPEESDAPTEPSEAPAESENPEESVEPTESENPEESQVPAESEKPEETDIPTESVAPTASVEPTESINPVETLKPFEIQLDPMKTMLPQLFSDVPFEGDGTAEDPYIIDSFEDMDAIHTYSEVDSVIYYELAADIVMPEDTVWTPIGTEEAPFKGVFNGACYSIEGLVINSSDDYQGLFGVNAGLIYDLSVYGTVSGGSYVGGIAAVNTGSIHHSLFNGTVTGKDYVGGLVGLTKGTWTEGALNGTDDTILIVGDVSPEYHEISRCYTAGEVTGENYVGGIAGSIDEEGAVWSSYSVANITGEAYVGGITGKMETITDNGYPFIDHVFALGTVSGTTNMGIICGATADENGLGNITTAYVHKMQDGDAIGNGKSSGVTVLDPYDFGNSAVMKIDNSSFEMSTTLNHPVLAGLESDDVVVEKVRYISSVDELKAFRDYVNSGKDTDGQTWYVTEDIDLADEAWTPIAYNSSYSFKGTFDGQEHIISGLLVTNYGPGGLFGYNMGIIQNVTVSGTMSGSYTYMGGIVGQSNGGSIIHCVSQVNVTGATYTGGIAGYANNTTISGCANEGEIRNYNNNYNYYGGIVGYACGATQITDCKNNGTVSSYDYVGGIVGYMQDTVSIRDCENSGAVTATYRWVGGIVGAALSSGEKTITNCTNSGTVTHTYNGNDSGRNIGGIVGRAAGVTIDSCTNTVDIETGCGFAGGIAGYAGDYPVTITNCKNEGNITDTNAYVGGIVGNSKITTAIENCENIGDITGFQYVGGVVGSSESSEIIISECQNSGTITATYNGDSFVGGIVGAAYYNAYNRTIFNCSNTGAIKGTNNVGGIAGYYWGDMDDCHNTGRVNGATYVGGLVGHYWNYNSWSTHKELSNSDNSGVVIGSNQYVGGLIGYAYGYNPIYFSITNCSNTNDVMNTREGGDGFVGGLIGYGYKLTLEDSYNIGNINGNFNCAGGIFGAWDGQTNIYRCYNSGNISCNDGSYIGGIIGYAGSSDSNWKYCQDSYNTGAISGKSAVGGIMGGYWTSWAYRIDRCYNFGNVSATNNYCGSISGYIAGQDYYTSNYFLYGTASGGVGQSNSTDGTMQGGRYELLTEEKFTNKEAFNTWDFDSVWMISDSLGRPILRSIPELSGDEATYQTEYYQQSIDGSYYKLVSTTKAVGRVNTTVSASIKDYNGFEQNTAHEDNILRGMVERDGSLVLKVYYDRTHLLEGSGTSEGDPYQIKTRADLEAFSSFVTDGWDTEGTYWQVMNDIDLENDQWTPIGTSTNVFRGTFSGGGYTITGLYINERNTSYCGLFSYNAGTIKNLTVSGRVVGNSYTGAIIGQNNSVAVVDNCRSEATVTGYSDFTGGLVGYNSGTIKNSENAGDVIHPSGNYAGGIAGYNNGIVEFCVNNGSVTSTNNSGYTGGIVGGYGTVRNCRNNGSVISTASYVGGISGYSSTIEKCENYGIVKSSISNDAYIGGIVGYQGTVRTSANWADVIAYGNYIGGIGGCRTNVDESFNAGNVFAYGNGLYVGGIVGGYNGSTYHIYDCYNTGFIRGAVCAGGIVGNRYNSNNQVYRCYNYGPVSAQNYCGSIAGLTYNNNTGSCFYLSDTCEKAFGNPSGTVDVAVMLTEAKFAEKSHFTGFSFSDKWAMSKTLGRPILKNAPEEGYVTITITDGEDTEVQAPKGIRLMDAYSFDYSKVWQDSNNNLVDFDTAITSDLSVTAVEITEGMEVNYQVKHRRKNLSNSYDEELEMKTAHVGDTVTAIPKDYEGFHVVDTAENVEITSNMQVLTVNYERDEFTVTFEMGESGLENTTQTVLYGGTATAPGKTTWAKHEFVGWFTTDTGPINFNFNTPVTENITVYGRWDNRYKVSFITGEAATHISEQYVVPGTQATQPSATPTKPGYAFAGWYTDAECTKAFSFNTVINENTNLYAKWLRGLVVHFEVGEGATPVEDQTVVKDGTATQPKNPSKYGYAFGGWYADKDLTKAYNFSTPVTANITIYAKWNKTYIVTFETGEGASKVDPQEVVPGSTARVPSTPTKDNYAFDGWYTTTDYTSQYNFNIEVNSDITLYAKWVMPLIVTFVTGDGATEVKPQLVAPGKPITRPSDPTKDGFVFRGWYTTEDYTNEFNFTTAINNNITLYAKWNDRLAIPGLTGMGTPDDPYQISNKAEYNTAVNWMNSNWDNTHGRVFVLTDDIDLENSMPRVTNNFYGVLDGQGHTIKNIYWYSSSSYVSMFANNYGTIKNLTLEGEAHFHSYSAILCNSNHGIITDCINKCKTVYTWSTNYHGGLVMRNQSSGIISKCSNEATIYDYGYIGGIACENYGLIEDCFNNGQIQYGWAFGGGIVYYNQNGGRINRCYNFANVQSNNGYFGAIAGQNSGTITDCYYLSGTNQYGVNGSVNSAGHWQVLTAEEFTDKSNFANWDFNTVWKMSDERPVLRGISDIVVTPGVIGTEDEPQIIKDAYGLISLAEAFASGEANTAYVKLGASIDLAGVPMQAIGSEANPFNGVFDGNGYTLKNFSMEAPLFGANSGTIKALIIDGNVSGNAGIVGINSGIVFQCSFNGTVSGTDHVGGIVGVNTANATVEQCYVKGTVTGTGIAGGIAGSNAGSVVDCYNMATVNGTTVGGVAGDGAGSITNCYNGGVLPEAGIGIAKDATQTGTYTMENTVTDSKATSLTEKKAVEFASYEGWDFGTVWGMHIVYGRPVLLALEEVYDGSKISASSIVIETPGSYTVIGDADTSVKNNISITNPGEYNLTIKNVSNNMSEKMESAGIGLCDGAEVRLNVVGRNTITAGAPNAGIQVPETAKLYMTGNGSITATGGTTFNVPNLTPEEAAKYNGGGAGIGGGLLGTSGYIEIDMEGYVYANGSPNMYFGAAGIGGGSGSAASMASDNNCNTTEIVIKNGTIHAKGSINTYYGGAGIGGGSYGRGENITISGGHVIAEASPDSHYGAAGIGGGSVDSSKNNSTDASGNPLGIVTPGADGSNITINGTATVTAIRSTETLTNGAGIGGGNFGYGHDITIDTTGLVSVPVEATVTLNDTGAGIGGGCYGNGYNIEIKNGTVNVNSAVTGAGIGGGTGGNGYDITISGGKVTATAQYHDSIDGGAGIGGGMGGHAENITITSKDNLTLTTVKATGSYNAAGIGGGGNNNEYNSLNADGETVLYGEIANNKTYAKDITITGYVDVTATGKNKGAGIGGGGYGYAHNILINNTGINKSSVKAYSVNVNTEPRTTGAGIGGGYGKTGIAVGIEITGNVAVSATADSYSSGIGGGQSAMVANIYIHGENTTVYAKGGSGNSYGNEGTAIGASFAPAVNIRLEDLTSTDVKGYNSGNNVVGQNNGYAVTAEGYNNAIGGSGNFDINTMNPFGDIVLDEELRDYDYVVADIKITNSNVWAHNTYGPVAIGGSGGQEGKTSIANIVITNSKLYVHKADYCGSSSDVAIGLGPSIYVDLNVSITNSPLLDIGNNSGYRNRDSAHYYYPSPLIGSRSGGSRNDANINAHHINEKIIIDNVDSIKFYCDQGYGAAGCVGFGSFTENSIADISITNCKSITSVYTKGWDQGVGISGWCYAIPGIGTGHNSYNNTITATIENCGSVGLGAGIGLGAGCYNNVFTATVTNCGDLTAGYIGTMGGCHDNVVDIDINTPLTDGPHSITAQSIGMGIGCSQTTDTAKCDINIDGYTGGMTITPVTGGNSHPNVGIGIGGESRSTDPNIPLNADIFINNCGTLTFNLNGYSTGIGVGNGSYGNVAGNINITNCDDINMHCTSNSCYEVTGIGVGANSYSSGVGCEVKPEISINNCGIINMRLSDASTGIGVGGRSRTSANSSIINPHIDIHDCEGIVMTLGAYTTGIGMGFGSYNNFPDMAKVTADIDITRCGNFDINIGDSSVGMGVGGYLMAGNLTQQAQNVALDLDIVECGKMKIETEDARGTSMTTNRSGVGIGVGYRYHDTNEVDNGNSRINIDIVGSGDTLTVTGSENGAAIGTGKAVYDRAKLFVNISNMDVVAKAGDNTAAIGVGADCNGAYDKGTINISNSDVKATGGAGVGVGQLFTDGSFTVNLTDCSVESNALHGAGLGFAADAVRATFSSTLTNCTGKFVGGGYAAGMGMGRNSAGSTANITILGGDIIAKGSNGGAGIGCGPFGSNCTPIITIDDNATVTAIGSASTKPYSSIPGVGEVLDEVQANRIAGAGAGIGGAENQNAGQITINSGTVTATGASLTDYNAAGIGGGKNGDGGIILITGGTVTATSGYTETDGAAGIGGGYGGNGGSITITGGNVTANGMGGISSGGAGIGGGPFGNGGDVVIYGNAVVNAIGSERASGIGGGFRANGHDVKIYGGKGKDGEPDPTMQPTVIAKSGLYDAAAIGGGAGGGDGGDVLISAIGGVAPIVKAYGYSSTVAIPGDITCEGMRLIQGTMKDTYDYDLALRVQNKVEEGETPTDSVNAVLPATYDAFSVTVMDTNDGAKTYNVFNTEEVNGVEQKYLLSTFAEDKFDFDLENNKDYHALQLTIIKYYTVSYDTGEGGPEIKPESVRGEMTATQPADPEWEGHIFSGWYADSEFTTVFDFSTPITKNTTVYAKWIKLEPSQILYKVEHYKQDTDGSGYYLFLTDYFVGVFGDEVSAEYKEIPGFHKNRSNPDTLLEGTLSDEETLTMKCFYDRDIIRVLLLNVDATQGQGGFIEAPYGTSVMLAMPSKGGYEFDKWTRLNPDGEEVPFMTLMKIETLGPAVYANWTLKAGCAYQVRHFLRGLDGIYTLDMQEDFAAAVGDEVIAEPYSYTGFHVNESISEESRKGIAQEDNSTVLRIYYDRDVITVNLIDSYNDELTEVTKQYGDVASIPTPYREGYIFKGWHKDDGDLIDNDALINEIGENATAYWEPIIIEEVANYSTRYHFQTPDGLYVVKEIVDQIGLIGDLVHAPIKTFIGYTFNKDKSNYTGVVDDKGTLALNLYYDLNLYEVEFDSDGGSYVAPITNIQHGTSINAPRVPTKTGYEFLGWYDEGLTVEWNFRNPVMGNMTLYAKWDAGTSAYKVEHYIEDLDGEGYTLYGTDNLSGKTDSVASAVAKDIKGFAQNKKHPLTVLTGKVTEDGSLVLKVYYDRIDVLVKYESNGGTDFSNQTVKYGSLAEELAPTKAGYDFACWCADHSLQKEFDFETPITEATILYAKWTPRNDTPFTTIYYLEDPTEPGTYHLNEDMTVIGYGTTEKVMHALYPNVDGYHVNEDHPDANVVDIIRGDGSMILEVYYSCNDKTVIFETNGGTLVDAQTVPFGGVATETETFKQGYTFVGWYSDEALTESYDFEAVILTDITLYAKWEAAETSYKVEHYLQTVSQNGYNLENTETFVATTGTSVTAEALEFIGFHENKEYSFRVKTAEVNADGTTTLKLFYDRDRVTLTFDTQGGSSIDPETTVYGGIIPAPGNPSKAGYRFNYWYEYPSMTGLDEVLNVMEQYANGEIDVIALREWFTPGNNSTSTSAPDKQLTALGFTQAIGVTNPSAATSKIYLSNARDRIPAIADALKTDSSAYKDGHLNMTWYQMQYYLWKTSTAINSEIKSKGLISPADAYDYWVQKEKLDKRPQWVKDFGTSGEGVTEYGVRVLSDGTQCLLWGTPGEGIRHDFNNPVTRNMTVYAKWVPAEGTAYRENYYYQNINDDNYTLVGTVGMAGKTGETATADTTAPYGFHLNENAAGSKLTGEITPDGKLVLNVYFDRDLYTVTYDENGGEDVEDATVRYGAAVEPVETTKAGYTFLGWYKDGKKFNFSNSITENITVVAGWELRSDVGYTIEYYTQTIDKSGYELTNTEKGTGSITTEVKADTTAPTGFMFNPNADGTLTSGTILADGSLVLKVFFDRKSFTVAFDANGGSDVEDVSVVYGEVITSPETTKKGYTFDGWFTEAGEKFDFTNGIDKNYTLTAKWVAVTGLPFRINYYYTNINSVQSDAYILKETVKGEGSFGQVITADTTEPQGYTLNREKSAITGTLTADKELILDVYFDAVCYTVTYETNGGSKVEAYSALYGEILTAPVTTKKGYTFDGWWIDEQLTVRYDFTKPVIEDMTLYAKWVESGDVPYRIEYYYQNINDDGYELKLAKDQMGFVSDYIVAETDPAPVGFVLNTDISITEGQVSLDNMLILKVYYDRIEYTLSFETNGGKDVDSITGRYGKKVTAPKTTKLGYELTGWYVDETLTTEYDFSKGITGDMTLYAKWIALETVTFKVKYYYQNINNNNYTWAKDETVTGYGVVDQVVLADTEAQTGFHLNESKTTATGKIKPDGSLTLEVYFDRDVYELTFHANDGEDVDPIYTRYGKIVTSPMTSRDGYIFKGWFMDEDLRIEYDFNVPTSGDTELYAKWKPVNSIEYMVNYYYQNINDDNYTLVASVERYASMGSTVTANTTAPEGFVFNGDMEGTVLTGNVQADGSLTLSVYFDRLTYTLTFNTDNGTEVSDITARYGKILTSPVTKKPGYEFLGWFEDETFETEHDFAVPVASDHDLHAKWLKLSNIPYVINYFHENLNDDEYTLVKTTEGKGAALDIIKADTTAPVGFVLNDGSDVEAEILTDGSLVMNVYFDRKLYDVVFESNEGSDIDGYKVKHGTVITEPEITREGYSFLGWFSNEALTRKYDFTTPVTTDITLYAKWEMIGNIKYTVKYYEQNINNDDYTLMKTEVLKASWFDTVMADTTTPTGFTLNTKSVTSGDIKPDGSLVLEIYFDRNVYTIKFETNGGSKIENRQVKHGKLISSPVTTKAGYTFFGWFKNEDLTTEYDFSSPVTQDITLYAKWVAQDNIKYTIRYYEQNINDDEYTLVNTETKTAHVGDEITANTTAPVGFSINKELSVITGIVTVDEMLVLEVYYDRNVYTITFEENGGLSVKDMSVKHGKLISAPVTSKAGYVFDKWFIDEELTTEYDFTAPVTHNATLYAGWNALDTIEYTIKYYRQNINNDEYSLADTVTKAGHVGDEVSASTTAPTGFVWNEDKSSITGNILADGSLTLEVYFDRQTYKVHFETNGGSNVEDMAVKYGYMMTAPTTTKTGYNFEGWFADADLTTEYDFTLGVTSDHTLYAKWSKLTNIPFKVLYYYQNINDDLYTFVDTVEGIGSVDQVVTADTSAPDGFILSENNEMLTGTILADGSLVLKVYFDRVMHTISFETNGGTTVDNIMVRHGKVVTAPKTTLAGHDLGGWFTDKALTNEYDFTAPVTSDVTVYAKWLSWGNMEFRINYYQQNTDGKTYELLETVTGYGSVDQVITAEKQPDTGFHTNTETSVITGTIEAGKLLVLNIYFDRDIHTVNFKSNGGSVVAEIKALHGTTITAPVSTKSGYTLAGWYAEAELTTVYDFIKVVEADMTLFAKWNEEVKPTPTPKPGPSGGGGGGGGGGSVSTQYTVDFNSNGGTEVPSQKVSGKVTEPKAPEKQFFQFDGWFTDKELIKPFDFKKDRVKADTTLFAKWSYMGPSTYLNMEHIAYIMGKDDGLVHPESDITRAEVAMIFYRLLNEDTRKEFENNRSAFKDVKQGDWYLTAVSTLARMGILKGRGNGYFDPKAPITRAEFAVICSRFDTLDEIEGTKFSDVPKTYWAYKEIGSAAAKGWVEGIGGDKFAPNALISRAEAVTLINRVLGRATTKFNVNKNAGTEKRWDDNRVTDWYYWAMQEATNSHDYKLNDKTETWDKIYKTTSK